MPLSSARAWLDEDANRARGEFVLIVDAPLDEAPAELLSPEAERLLVALVAELPPARAARVAAAATNLARDALYARALALKARQRG
jgi:16S rRNA (cytidine1402-2'-O)-methyltransferase